MRSAFWLSFSSLEPRPPNPTDRASPWSFPAKVLDRIIEYWGPGRKRRRAVSFLHDLVTSRMAAVIPMTARSESPPKVLA